MWPVDVLWEITQKLVVLLVCVVVWMRVSGQRPSQLLKPLRAVVARRDSWPKGRLHWMLLIVLCISGLGWLQQSLSYGAVQTLAMALGGPTAEEITLCRQVSVHRYRDRLQPACPFGGHVTIPDLRQGGHCDKHGDLPGLWATPARR